MQDSNEDESVKGELIGIAMTAPATTESALVCILSTNEDGDTHLAIRHVGNLWDMSPEALVGSTAQISNYLGMLDMAKTVYELQLAMGQIEGGREDWDAIMNKVVRDASKKKKRTRD